MTGSSDEQPASPQAGARVTAVDRVRAALAGLHLAVEIRAFSTSTRTAHDAARAVGTSVAQIVKSLVFAADGRPILVLVSGTNRVDVRKVACMAGAAHVEMASPEMTREATGFSIGGVPPIGHLTPLPVYVDETLLTHPVVYAAAGTPRAVFAITPSDLVRVTRGEVGDIAEAGGLPADPAGS